MLLLLDEAALLNLYCNTDRAGVVPKSVASDEHGSIACRLMQASMGQRLAQMLPTLRW